MSTPFYVAPEQVMKDRADYARKGIARGRALVAVRYADGIALVSENPSNTLRKISEIYDRIAFAGVGKYNEFDQFRVAGVRAADLKGYQYSRDDVDAYAVESQKRAKAAWDAGHFKKSIVPVKDQNGIELLAHDELMRPQTTMQTLAALEPSFKMQGEAMPGFNAVAQQRYPEIEKMIHVHHAGNSSGIVDGAAAILLGTKEFGEKAGLKPRARIRSFASIGSEPAIMLTGPVDVTKKVLARARMSLSNIDLFEVNEAFAAVVLRYLQAFSLDPAKVNVNGGAIALGHPLGATGAMLLGAALDELERSGKATALVTLCIGAGMGTATIIERV